jgi:hypothetical protein
LRKVGRETGVDYAADGGEWNQHIFLLSRGPPDTYFIAHLSTQIMQMSSCAPYIYIDNFLNNTDMY